NRRSVWIAFLYRFQLRFWHFSIRFAYLMPSFVGRWKYPRRFPFLSTIPHLRRCVRIDRRLSGPRPPHHRRASCDRQRVGCWVIASRTSEQRIGGLRVLSPTSGWWIAWISRMASAAVTPHLLPVR